jgi:hypothetical protein
MTSKKKMDKPTQTPQNDPKKKITIPIQILYRKSSQNNPNQNKNQEIKPKNYTYPITNNIV